MNYPDLVEACARALRKEIDKDEGQAWHVPDSYHASDLGYLLPSDDGGLCLRQRVLRWRGVTGSDIDPWTKLMWEQGFAFERRIETLIGGELDDWIVTPDVRLRTEFEGRTWVGESDVMLTNKADDTRIILEVKSHRSGAEKYLDSNGAKRSHVVQAQWYAYASGAESVMIFYVSRDGASRPRVFHHPADPQEVETLMRAAHQARESGLIPDVPDAEVTDLKRAPQQKHKDKHPGRYRQVAGQWKKIMPFWQCDGYCQFANTEHCGGSVAEWKSSNQPTQEEES